jgi:hypothetical protein
VSARPRDRARASKFRLTAWITVMDHAIAMDPGPAGGMPQNPWHFSL